MNNWIMSPPWSRRARIAPDSDEGSAQTPAATRADLDAAYRRGRRDGRRRGRHPILAFIGLVASAATALVIYLAVQTGSFANGGAVVDQHLADASQRVQSPFKTAAMKVGNALETAGQSLKQRSGEPARNS
jgi:hypothetical protein